MTRWLGTTRSRWLGWLVLAVVLLPAVHNAAARAPVPHPKRKELYKEQVEQMEQQWRTAELSNDLSALDHMLASDYIGIMPNGQVVTKVQQLDRMRSRQLVITRLDLDDVKVKLVGTTAIVTSLADVDGSMDEIPMMGKYRYTRVYTRLPSGSWRITNFEATPVGMPHPQPMSKNSPAPEAQRPE